MSYCLNPDCKKPKNHLDVTLCINCGTKILLGDRYRSVKIIGQGGFGRTFLAIDEAKPSKPKCVIKQFYPQAQGTDNVEKAKQLFEQEAIRLEELGNHDQIPNLLAYLTQDNRQYLVQQFINGNHLEAELETKGKFSENQILELLKQLLPVLQYLHENNVIHRDIKPENIIINQEQKYILVDFGAAKLVTGKTAKKGTVIGSAGFLAPEQARGKAIFASDIYSLGVTCIYLLTQTHPFDLMDHVDCKWIWQNHLTTTISDFLIKIIDKMILEDYDERYQSVSEIIADLSSITEPVNHQTWYCIKTLTGHNDVFAGIRTLAFTPDSKILASGSEDWTIKLWNLSTGNEIRTLTNHHHFIRSIVFTPDGKNLISASDDRKIKIWDWRKGEELYTLEGHTESVTTIAISPDGKILASGSDDKTIKLWNLETNTEILTLQGHTDYIQSVVFHPHKNILASGSCDNKIKIWDLNENRELLTLKDHANYVKTICFSPNGEYLVSGSDDHNIKLWKWQLQEIVYTVNAHKGFFYGVFAVNISPNGKILVSGGVDNTMKIWDLGQGELLQTVKENKKGVPAVIFSPDGKIIASGSYDKTIKIWSNQIVNS